MTKIIGVSVGSDGAVWCCDSLGDLYMRTGSKWSRNPTAIASEVAVGNAQNVWCRNPEGRVFRLDGSTWDSDWDRDPVASIVTRSISVGSDGTLWVVNAKGELVKLENGTWRHNPHRQDAMEVSVGNADHVWYRNTNGKIARLQGSSYDGDWVEDTAQASQVASVSAAADGTLWVTNDSGQVFKRVGNKWERNPIASAEQISCGANHLVWCVNDAGQIFHAETPDWNTTWRPVSSPVMPQRTYTVQLNDTLGEILKRIYGLTGTALWRRADEVAALNGWPNREHVLHPNDVIILEA